MVRVWEEMIIKIKSSKTLSVTVCTFYREVWLSPACQSFDNSNWTAKADINSTSEAKILHGLSHEPKNITLGWKWEVYILVT